MHDLGLHMFIVPEPCLLLRRRQQEVLVLLWLYSTCQWLHELNFMHDSIKMVGSAIDENHAVTHDRVPTSFFRRSRPDIYTIFSILYFIWRYTRRYSVANRRSCARLYFGLLRFIFFPFSILYKAEEIWGDVMMPPVVEWRHWGRHHHQPHGGQKFIFGTIIFTLLRLSIIG